MWHYIHLFNTKKNKFVKSFREILTNTFRVLANNLFKENFYGKRKKKLGLIWYMCLNTCFQFLNNITHVSTYFFTNTYFQKIQTTLLE